MKKTLLTLIILGTVTAQVLACSCDYQGDFLTVAPKTKLVAFVKVLGYPTVRNWFNRGTVAMEVEIQEVYRGKESRKEVIVWGDDGTMCRPYVSWFKPGQY
jgi:hypothetical protein